MKNTIIACIMVAALFLALFGVTLKILPVAFSDEHVSYREVWKVLNVTSSITRDVDVNITVSPSREGVHLACSTNITKYFEASGSYKSWWEWLNGTSGLQYHWGDMDWIVSYGSLTPITYDQIQHWGDMYLDTGSVPYWTFMGNTYMADCNLTRNLEDPDIVSNASWTGNTIKIIDDLRINATIRTEANIVFKIVITEPGVYTFNITATEGVTLSETSWVMGGAKTLLVPYDHTSIQNAIGNATAEDTIIVHPGTYPENVAVTKNNLTIKALYQATTEGALGNAIVSPASGNGFTVRADGITIDGFEITAGSGDGIYFEGSNNIFQYNLIHDINTGGTGGGICCWDLDGGSNNNQILRNTIYNCTADAILYGASNVNGLCNWRGIISNNTMWNLATQDGWNPSVEVVNGQNFTISGNTVIGRSVQYYGILLYSWNGVNQGNHIVSNNTVTGHYTGICAIADTNGGVYQGLGSVATANFKNLTFAYNNASGANYHGMQLRAIPNAGTASVSKCTISNSVFFNNGLDGINLLDSNVSDIGILANNIYGNGRDGIRLYANSRVIINYNNFYSNGGADVNKTSAPTVDARFNWWGNASGPTHSSNPGGTGGNVSDNVDFKPWLIKPYAPGQVVSVSVVYVDPQVINLTAPALGTTFTIDVKIANVTMMYGIQFTLEWNSTFLNRTGANPKVPAAWVGNCWVNQTSTESNYSLAMAPMVSGAPTFNGSASLVSLNFQTIKDPIYPNNFTCLLNLTGVTIGDASANPIPHIAYSGNYSCYSTMPKLLLTPPNPKAYKIPTEFAVNVTVTNVVNLDSFEFNLTYDPTLLNVIKVENPPGIPVPYQKPNNGSIYIRVEGISPTISGNRTLVTITFKVMRGFAWNTQTTSVNCTLGFDPLYTTLNLTKPIAHEAVNGTYSYVPLQGDVCPMNAPDGLVDIGDLLFVANKFGTEPGGPPYDDADMNRDGKIDILDVILVARNFGAKVE
jgi:hypothetical protein